MEITKEILVSLGFIKTGKTYSLISNGIKFNFEPDEKLNNVWKFYYNNDKKTYHLIDHLDEVFGLISSDFYDFGKTDAKKEVRDFLLNIEE